MREIQCFPIRAVRPMTTLEAALDGVKADTLMGRVPAERPPRRTIVFSC